jgi:hypothetical protein
VNSLLRKLPKPAFVFALALPLLWLRFGHWFYLSLDEGIYLEGARRVASGEVPYRDFFAITGPGTYWLYGTVFHFFGTSFAAARAVLCLELAATCAAICYLVSRSTGTLFAVGTSLLYLAMLLTTLYPIYITHRWDSNTLALLALCCLDRRPLLAGSLAAIAVWITPPLLFVAVALGVWKAFSPQPLRPYLLGLAIPTVAAVAVLSSQGALTGLIHALLWDSSHYASANRLPYGALAGTFRSFLAQGTIPAATIHYLDSLLPNLLPPLAAVATVIPVLAKPAFAPRRAEALLSVAAFAALAACYPRLGAAQLLFAASFLWVVCAVALNDLLPSRLQTRCAMAAILLATGATAVAWPREVMKSIDTPVETLRVSRRHFVTLNDLLSATRPGERAFVYPYLPALYFALGLQNPTRYAWLQPGMMAPADVQSAITSLKNAPPRWIIWHDFTEAYILKNWPSSDQTRLRFPEMESYLQSDYHVVIPDGVPTVGFKLMEKNP